MGTEDRKRVLVLEDEVLIAMDLELHVEDHGCTVVGPANTCSAALDLLKSHRVDAAILDLIVGDEECDTVADELTAKGIPWALSTGVDVEALEARYRDVLLIRKPFNHAEVQHALRTLLDPKAQA